jgi:peptide/nickel transport system permease protein
MAMFGVGVLVALTATAVFAPLIAPYGPDQLVTKPFLGPSLAHLCGTDELGRDILSRLIFGARPSLATAAGSAILAAIIGVPIGLFAGYLGGWVDAILMRLMDLLLSLPGILLALVVVTVLGGSTINVLLAVAVVSIPGFARLTRAETLVAKGHQYVLAARSSGASRLDVMFRTVLPNTLGPLIVQLVLTASLAILIAASLNFLGLGASPPQASWGAMLESGKTYIYQTPWYGLFPGIALTLTIGALDQVGRGAQAAFGSGLGQLKTGAMT